MSFLFACLFEDEQKNIFKYYWIWQSTLQQVGEESEHKEENEKTEPPENSHFQPCFS